MDGRNYEFICRRLALLQNTGIFWEENGELISWQENPESNPLYLNKELRQLLYEHAVQQKIPFLYRDAHRVCFGCILKDPQRFYFGPLSMEILDRVHMHYFYAFYGVEQSREKRLKKFTLSEIINLTQLLAAVLTGEQYTGEELECNSHLHEETARSLETDEIFFQMKSEEEEIYHHTYLEERKLLDCVREGRVEEAVQKSRNMDSELGKLSSKEMNHWRNVCIVAITLCTRAAIDSGVPPYIAYQISDFYIQKCDECRDAMRIIKYRDQAVERITQEVRKTLEKKHVSSYVEQCRDYVGKHYREKIYLEDIAENLGVSSTYLSRLFRKETGICLQDYITEFRVERAANLLIYSNESLPRIAEYVNFPSQSYFGKVFKKYKQMTPRKYRELHKPREF